MVGSHPVPRGATPTLRTMPPDVPAHLDPAFPPCRSADELRANLAEVSERIGQAAQRVGRDPGQVRLLPVSKTVGAERIRWAHEAGVRLVGENKVQEARSKADLFASLPGMQWAMIGHLQSNKIRHVVGCAVELHSLDSVAIAESLDRRLQSAGVGLDVFIQVNSSGEESKYGLAPADVTGFARSLDAFHSLNVRGLMTLALFSTDTAAVRRCFVRMVELRDRLRQDLPDPDRYTELSMGMSSDYDIAVEEGATTVRVGQAIFGARSTGPNDYWPGSVAAPD